MATGLAITSALHDYAISKAFDEKFSVWYFLCGELFLFWFWGAVTPGILAMMRRFPMKSGDWKKNALIHGTVYVGLAALYTVYYHLVDVGLGPNNQEGLQNDFLHMFWVALTSGVLKYYLPIFVAGYIVTYYTQARERERRNAELTVQLGEAQLRTLRAQLQPHFLFNTLHSIGTLVYTDPRRADEMITHLSDLLRMSLDAADSECVPLSEELDYLGKYLAIEQTRFSDRLSVQYSIDPNSLNFPVPHFILQPIVENAVWHGISKKAGKGTISVTTVLWNSCLRILVDDDGPGICSKAKQNGGGGLGLKNTTKRLEQFYGPTFRLAICTLETGTGTRVELQLPDRPAEEEPERNVSDPRREESYGKQDIYNCC